MDERVEITSYAQDHVGPEHIYLRQLTAKQSREIERDREFFKKQKEMLEKEKAQKCRQHTLVFGFYCAGALSAICSCYMIARLMVSTLNLIS